MVRMERHTATNVKPGRTMLSVKENVLVRSVLEYLTQFVVKMERHTPTNVKQERAIFSVRETALAKENLEDTEKSSEHI